MLCVYYMYINDIDAVWPPLKHRCFDDIQIRAVQVHKTISVQTARLATAAFYS